MFWFGLTVIKLMLGHYSGHDLKGLFLLRKVDCYVYALELRVEPKSSVLVDGQRKSLRAGVLIALS